MVALNLLFEILDKYSPTLTMRQSLVKGTLIKVETNDFIRLLVLHEKTNFSLPGTTCPAPLVLGQGTQRSEAM